MEDSRRGQVYFAVNKYTQLQLRMQSNATWYGASMGMLL